MYQLNVDLGGHRHSATMEWNQGDGVRGQVFNAHPPSGQHGHRAVLFPGKLALGARHAAGRKEVHLHGLLGAKGLGDHHIESRPLLEPENQTFLVHYRAATDRQNLPMGGASWRPGQGQNALTWCDPRQHEAPIHITDAPIPIHRDFGCRNTFAKQISDATIHQGGPTPRNREFCFGEVTQDHLPLGHQAADGRNMYHRKSGPKITGTKAPGCVGIDLAPLVRSVLK